MVMFMYFTTRFLSCNVAPCGTAQPGRRVRLHSPAPIVSMTHRGLPSGSQRGV